MRIFKPLGSDTRKHIGFLPAWKFDRFDVQARVYVALRKHGFDVRGEYLVPGTGLKPDLVIFDAKGKALAIVVVKGADQWQSETRQQREYRSFNVPVIAIANANEVPALITALDTLESA